MKKFQISHCVADLSIILTWGNEFYFLIPIGAFLIAKFEESNIKYMYSFATWIFIAQQILERSIHLPFSIFKSADPSRSI